MENITIGQIAGAITVISIIIGAIFKVIKMYKHNIVDRFDNIENRLEFVEKKRVEYEKEVQFSNLERKILLKGELAALKGLKGLGCDDNDVVTKSIEEIEQYMMDKTHNVSEIGEVRI